MWIPKNWPSFVAFMAKCWENASLEKISGQVTLHNNWQWIKVWRSYYWDISYKSLYKSSPDNLFDSMLTSKRRQDPLRNDLLVPSVKTVTKGKVSAKYLGGVTWNSVPSHITQQDSLEKFCDLIKLKSDCNCKLCKDYIGHAGYVQIVEWFPFI